jgi:hypothetical protein
LRDNLRVKFPAEWIAVIKQFGCHTNIIAQPAPVV